MMMGGSHERHSRPIVTLGIKNGAHCCHLGFLRIKALPYFLRLALEEHRRVGFVRSDEFMKEGEDRRRLLS